MELESALYSMQMAQPSLRNINKLPFEFRQSLKNERVVQRHLAAATGNTYYTQEKADFVLRITPHGNLVSLLSQRRHDGWTFLADCGHNISSYYSVGH